MHIFFVHLQRICKFALNSSHVITSQMANTKSSDIRYQVLDRCLHRGGFSTAAMAEEVNRELELRGYNPVNSLNTIRKDLDHIAANHSVEIEECRHGRNVTYRYTRSDMSIYNVGLNDDDVVQLSQAFAILSRFDGMPQLDWLQRTLSRLRLSVNIPTDGPSVVGFDDCAKLKGRQYFSKLLAAINERAVLEIQYQKYHSEQPRSFTISPCYLKEHSRRWFLLGMREKYEQPMVLALDRIVSVTVLPDEEYRPAAGIDFNNGYFKDIVGVTRFHDQQPQEVVLEVSSERIQYIITKPIHDSQKVIGERGDKTLVSPNVIPNVELSQILLSYGSAITVISPVEFRNYLADNVAETLQNYIDAEQHDDKAC